MAWIGREPWIAGAFLGGLPLAALLLRLLHARGAGNESPWKYLYSALVYAACVPGMFGAVIAAYAVFITRENLLDLNALVTVGAPVSMAVTLLIASRSVRFRPLPGFGRLSGLLLMIGATFGLVLAISRTRLWLFFGGSLAILAGAAIFIFAVLRWGAFLAFGRRRRKSEAPDR